MIDYKEWADKKGPKLKSGNNSAIAALTQAQPALEALTQQPYWDLFLSYIASAIETWEKERAQLTEALAVYPLGVDDLLRMRHRLVLLSTRIDTARRISQLPKDLIAAGDKALSLEVRLEDKKGAILTETRIPEFVH